MSWDKGADRIDELVARGFLQQVPASPQAAHLLIAEAQRHLESAETIADADPQGAYALTYDAARKAMAAVLEAQGLRAASAGGHVVLYDASTNNPPITADESGAT